MQTSIELQELYNYSIMPIIIFVFLTFLVGCYLICLKIKAKNSNKFEKKILEIAEKNKKNILVIKKKHLKQLDMIENNYKLDIIDLRKAYQLVSQDIRLFVFEVTDVTTQNYSLSEIKKLNMPELYDLIKEYYEPEFASKSIGDFESSINKARGIINKWN